MLSLDNFYSVLYTNLFLPLNFNQLFFSPMWSVNPLNLSNHNDFLNNYNERANRHMCVMYDQEPLMTQPLVDLINDDHFYVHNQNYSKILANSEKSQLKKIFLKQNNCLDWYYFYHGFAALDWYRDAEYYNSFENQYTNLFISLNRLHAGDRSYRVSLLAELAKHQLIEKGKVSFHGTHKSVIKELLDPNTQISKYAKSKIKTELLKIKLPLTVDNENIQGYASAAFNLSDYKLLSDSFWHLVPETIFYHDKLHLTEKIFKPIVVKRPFILIGAKDNLKYLKSYGFETFDKWIDESYDSCDDPDKRIEMAVGELAKLSKLSDQQLRKMFFEIREVTEYNFNHFYGNFKKIIVNEMFDNFLSQALFYNNTTHNPNHHIQLNCIDFAALKQKFYK